MSGIVSFDDLFPLKAAPSNLDRVFGFDSEDGKSRGFQIQAILDLIAATPVTWASIDGKPSTFAPASHTLGSHSNVAGTVDSAADGTFLKKVAGQITAVAVDFYGVSNPPPADGTIDDALRLITAARIAQWDSAFGWGNHAGQYRPVAWVPTWGDVSDKPATFAPSGHTLGSHSDAAALASATEGQLVRKAAVGFEAFTSTYYSPTNPPPIDASVPDFVRDFTIGQFAGYEAKMLEFAGLPDGAVPLIKDGVPVDIQLKGIYSENPFDPETETEDYDAFVEELLYLITTQRIKGPAGVDPEDYAIMSQLFSGAYGDLTGLPSLFSGAYADLSGLPSLFSGAYADLSGLPTLFFPTGTATDGHVVTSVAGVATWQAPSGGGGGSNWTVSGSDIYRNSKVTIGQTTIISADLGINQVSTAIPAIRINSFIASSGVRNAVQLYADSVLRYSLTNYGIPTWNLFDGGGELGSMAFSTTFGALNLVTADTSAFTTANRAGIYWKPMEVSPSNIAIRIYHKNTDRIAISGTGRFAFNSTGFGGGVSFTVAGITGDTQIMAWYFAGVKQAWVTTDGSFNSANFTGTTARAWKLGERKVATTALDTTQYLTVQVNGVTYNLALVTI